MPKHGNKPQHITWIRDHLDYPHADFCLIWPFASLNNGYGVFVLNGKKHYVHRYICEQKTRPAPHLGKPDDRIHKATPGDDRANFRSVSPLGFWTAVYHSNAPHLRAQVAA